MAQYQIIVIGGGPAGLMAAGQAASQGRKTLLLEKMDQPGRKLLLTGKGRCNLTNTAEIPDSLRHFNQAGSRFLKYAFYTFHQPQLREFFARIGVPTMIERGGRVFPESGSAREVLAALQIWTKNQGVKLQTGCAVRELLVKDSRIEGVVSNQGPDTAPAVILASGGKSYPGTGSSGDGYALARLAGHTIQPLSPSLVPLSTAGNTASDLQGLTLKNILLTARSNREEIGAEFGEVLFTHFGLSGPALLTLSREIVPHLESGHPVEIQIDLKPALDRKQLDARLLRDIQSQGGRQYSTLLEGLLPRKLIPVCLEQTGVPRSKANSQLSGAERGRLLDWLKGGFRFVVTGHRGYQQAIVTAGGVSTAEIHPSTMESRQVSGLYLAGEVIDIDADTGGYNLQAAFSTGWIAGRAAATSG